MLGDSIVLIAGPALLLAIPLCFRLARSLPATAVTAGPDSFSPGRTLALLILGTLTLTGGTAAALFGGTWWLSPLGSVLAAAVVGAMLCGVASLTVVPTVGPRAGRARAEAASTAPARMKRAA